MEKKSIKLFQNYKHEKRGTFFVKDVIESNNGLPEYYLVKFEKKQLDMWTGRHLSEGILHILYLSKLISESEEVKINA